MSSNGKLARREHSLSETDMMPGPLRACVHEFGFAIVDCMRRHKISEPRVIREIVKECWGGARSIHDTNGKNRHGSSPVAAKIDWLLIQNGAGFNADTLIRLLYESNLVIIPMQPSITMIDASIAATAEMGLVSKREKHLGRLRAAVRAQAKSMWPRLFDT